MELFQIFWDDHHKLFLEFKKDEEEQRLFLPEKIKRLTLQFEILKKESFHKQPPYLISIKKLYHSSETLSFSIELDELFNIDELQIIILRVTIFLYSGQRFQYYFEEKYKIADIWVNEDCYSGFEFEELHSKRNFNSKVSQEKIFQEIETITNENKEKRTMIYQKSKIESLSDETSLAYLINEGNKTLKRIEQALQNLSISYQNTPQPNIQYVHSIPIRERTEPGIERIKRPIKPALIQGQMSSNKLLVIKEMKSIFNENIDKNSEFNIKAILKPLSDDELEAIMLDDEELMKKEEQAIKNQIKRLKKQQKTEIRLENLKPPKK